MIAALEADVEDPVFGKSEPELAQEIVFEDPPEELEEEPAVLLELDSDVGVSISEDMDFESMEGDASFLSDSPFNNKAFNDTIGIGGGAGGKVGHRSGGRRNIRARGGSGIASLQSPAPRDHSGYAHISENKFIAVGDDPLSTFSIDVDTASYANLRGYLMRGARPPIDAVRIEEMVNYFAYDYAPPTDGRPFAVHAEVASCPWKPEHRLVKIGLKGHELVEEVDRARNLVFLIDVSGSMNASNKLALAKDALKLLVESLNEEDRISIVVYAGREGVALEPTHGSDHESIRAAVDAMASGGSTNGAAGIELAYRFATQNFIEGGINRVVLMTDGDFNVGVTDNGSLTRMIQEKAKTGVFLSVLGYGMGNLKDDKLEALADKGNGNYAYIDSLREAHKVLVREMRGTLVTIAKDVKIQVEFNPAEVSSYRLIGYENRKLAHADFNDDKKDAGELGYGHTVTALYEVVPVSVSLANPAVDPLKYQAPTKRQTAAADSGEIMNVKLRYKSPDGTESQLIEGAVADAGMPYHAATIDFRFASAVAAFGMMLRDSEFIAGLEIGAITELAQGGLGKDPYGYRAEFIELVERFSKLTPGE